jgi:hypothetical protein
MQLRILAHHERAMSALALSVMLLAELFHSMKKHPRRSRPRQS